MVGGKDKGEKVERIRILEDEGRAAMVVDGVTISVAVDGGGSPSGYWAAMMPEGPVRSALLLGLGGGTLAHLLARRYGGIEMVGVDSDAEVVGFARQNFGLDLPNLSIVVGDAFEFVEACERAFDFIAVDLFAGYDFQRSSLSRPFLRKLKAMAGRGEITFNLFRDKRTEKSLDRIRRVLRIARIDEVGKNVVVHCRG